MTEAAGGAGGGTGGAGGGTGDMVTEPVSAVAATDGGDDMESESRRL